MLNFIALDFISAIVSTAQAVDPVPAAPAVAAAGPSLASFLPLIIIFVIFYFLLIRPQSKRAKQNKAMVAALAKGDEVVTNGMLGRVTSLDDNFIGVEIAKGVEVRMQRQAVTQVMPKGTVK